MSQLSNSKNIKVSETATTSVPIHYDEEYQLNNYLEDPFKKLIFPLYLMHRVTLNAKYKIRYGFLTPNSFCYKIFCLFSNICVYVAYCLMILIYKKKDRNLIAHIFDFIVFFIGFSYNFLDSILLSGAHTKLILEIQKAQSAIGCFDEMNKSILIRNWCTVGAVVTFYAVNIFANYVTNRLDCSGLLRLFVAFSLDMNIIYLNRMLVLLKTVVKLWISKVKELNLRKLSKCNYESRRWRNAEKAYIDVIHAFNIYKSLVQFPVFYSVLMNFIEVLTGLEKIIASSEDGSSVDGIALGFTVVWMIKDLIELVAISWGCDQFYATVVNAYLECLYHVNFRNCSDRSRNLCKRVQHESTTCEPLSACGFCVVDATLPLRYISAITTYVVVLLQFHFQ